VIMIGGAAQLYVMFIKRSGPNNFALDNAHSVMEGSFGPSDLNFRVVAIATARGLPVNDVRAEVPESLPSARRHWNCGPPW
jgi:hypothetical protein